MEHNLLSTVAKYHFLKFYIRQLSNCVCLKMRFMQFNEDSLLSISTELFNENIWTRIRWNWLNHIVQRIVMRAVDLIIIKL